MRAETRPRARYFRATLIAAASLALGAFPARSTADTPPAPPLDMREYREYTHHGRPDSAFEAGILLPTILLGKIVFSSYNEIYLTLDTAYSRWAIGAYRDYYLGNTKTSPPVDKALYDERWIVRGSIDKTGKVAFDHMVPGKYIVFGGVELRTGNAKQELAMVPGFNADGIETTAPVPTLSFTDVKDEALYFMIPFEVTSEHSTVTGTPQLIGDKVLY